MSKIVISITGHRQLSAVQMEKVRPVIRKAIENIMFTVREHEPKAMFAGLSPLAEGADTLFAEVAGDLGLPVRVILPFEPEEYAKQFSGDEARQAFFAIYNHVDVQDKRVNGSVKQAAADKLYLDMGRELVHEADYLIAVWNEKAANGKGGTAEIVTYAKEKEKNILVVNPEDERPHINYLHRDRHRGKDSMAVIDTAQTDHLASFIAHRQREYDDKAVYYNRRYKQVWTAGFVIGLVEVFAFSVFIAFNVSLGATFLLSTIEFACILSIIGLLLFGRSKHLHSSYVHYRIVGERLRIKKFFADLGLRIYHTTVSPIYFSFKEKPEYSILDNTIKLINLSAYSYLSFDEKKRRLLDELIADQHRYHQRKMEKFEKKNDLYKNVRKILFIVFAAAVTAHFAHVANEYFLHQGVHLTDWSPAIFHFKLFEELTIFCSIFIPALVAASEALKYLYEWEKIITLSSAMSNYFKEKERKLAHVRNEEELEAFINGINRDMLIENLDWEKYMHDKNEVPT